MGWLIFLTGRPGVGKTSILLRAADSLEAKGYKIQFSMKTEEATSLESEFQKVVTLEREKFPIKKEGPAENA